jgi:hypothetical protein
MRFTGKRDSDNGRRAASTLDRIPLDAIPSRRLRGGQPVRSLPSRCGRVRAACSNRRTGFAKSANGRSPRCICETISPVANLLVLAPPLVGEGRDGGQNSALSSCQLWGCPLIVSAPPRAVESAEYKGVGQVIHRIRCALCPSSLNQFLQRPIMGLFRMMGIASMDRIESAFIVTAMTSCLVLIGAAILTAFF